MACCDEMFSASLIPVWIAALATCASALATWMAVLMERQARAPDANRPKPYKKMPFANPEYRDSAVMSE
jgi:hypothetical protein